jgi:hypothetical protein
MNISIKKNTPAPGTYGRGIEINSTGNYCLSTIPNSRAAAWSPSKSRFIHSRPSVSPGPGVYNPTDYNNGNYVLSQFKSGGITTMRKPERHRAFSISKHETPGPGAYMPPSDFGYLELYKFSPRTS